MISKILKYRVVISHKNDESGNYYPTSIDLYLANNTMGYLHFKKNIPYSVEITEGGNTIITLDDSEYGRYLDILRNEDPVYFRCVNDITAVFTQAEEVGEEES